MLWLAVLVCPPPACVCVCPCVHGGGGGVGHRLLFLLLDGRGNVDAGSAEGQGGGYTLAPRCPCIMCGWPISAGRGRGGRRDGRCTGQNHRLTEVPWWVELGVWFPNAVTPLKPPPAHTLTLNKHRHTNCLPSLQVFLPLNTSMNRCEVCAAVCAFVFVRVACLCVFSVQTRCWKMNQYGNVVNI